MGELDSIVSSGVQACLLEAKAGKPGNVSPGKDFRNTSYSDFVSGSRALRPVLRECALRGFKAGSGKLPVEGIRIGLLVEEGVKAVRKSHKGGNTHLGIIMLLVPLAAAAGFCVGSKKSFRSLRVVARKILLGTTLRDSLDFFDAVNLAAAGGLGKSKLDVGDKKSRIKLRKLNMSFIKLMKYSSRRDRVAGELSSGFPIVFEFVVPNFRKNQEKTRNLNNVIVQTYLQTLAKYPDTLISRKLGLKKSRQISERAKEVLKAGGVYTQKGRAKIRELDCYLRSDGNKLNPGTTADLITAGLFIYLISSRTPPASTP